VLCSLLLNNDDACRLCLGTWTDHGERTGGFYACNRYETAKQEGAVCNFYLYSFCKVGESSGWIMSRYWKQASCQIGTAAFLCISGHLSGTQHPGYVFPLLLVMSQELSLKVMLDLLAQES